MALFTSYMFRVEYQQLFRVSGHVTPSCKVLVQGRLTQTDEMARLPTNMRCLN